MLKNIFFYIIIILFFYSCDKNKKTTNKNIISISLERKLDTTLTFDFDFRITDFLLHSYKEQHPKYYQLLLKKHHSTLKNKDSFVIVSTNFIREKMYYNFLKAKALNTKDKRIANYYFKNFDTISFSSKSFTSQLNAAIYYSKNQKYLIIDTDNNGSFDNNKSQIFNKNEDYIQDINYQILYKKNVISIKRKVSIKPSPNYFFIRRYIKDRQYNQYALLLQFKDYYKGNFKVSTTKYNFIAQGTFLPKMSYFIYPDTVKVTNANLKNYEYRFKDTLLLSNKLFLIDSINASLFKIVLKKIVLNKPFLGSRIGEQIKLENFNNLEGKKLNLSNIYSSNKYTLIDFWGTWCAPCKKLTPSLISFNHNFKDVTLLSIAYDKSIQNVKNYIQKHKMDWIHGYLKERRGVLGDLNVTRYPTFILLNRKGKIIYRGVGEEALNQIKKILSKK